MWLGNAPILHVVDIFTVLQNATVLYGKTADYIRLLFIEYWASLYTRYHNIIRPDQNAIFTTKKIDI